MLDFAVPTLTRYDTIVAALAGLEKLALTASQLTREAAKVDPNPTDAQKESGNYRKGHVAWKGLNITIETAAGQVRRGVGKDGKPWQTKMRDHYGYVKGTVSDADGDHVDVFISCDQQPDTRGPQRAQPGWGWLRSELVHVINQVDPDTGKFDEHKVVLGCLDEESARQSYLRNYEPGWQGLGSVTALTLPQFKWWLDRADTSKEIKEGFFAAPANRKKSATDLIQKTAFDATATHILVVKRAEDRETPFTVAVDLDGTLAEKEEPFDPTSIGTPRQKAIDYVRLFREAGARIIIFTVRGDKELVEAWLEEHDVPYDYVNENPDQPEDASGKVIADAYWDDKAFNAEDPDEFGPTILRKVMGGKDEAHAAPALHITVVKNTTFVFSAPELLDAMKEAA